MNKTLVLVPTQKELERLKPLLEFNSIQMELCGFGPVAAAARAGQLLRECQPERVLLLGIAGAYDAALELGTAYSFTSVACCGVGVGTGADFRSAESIGWNHWGVGDDAIGDELPLAHASAKTSRQLLTVCATSDNGSDVELRTRFFKDAVAEDMEGFGVAVACHLAETPLTIIRGISNRAGDRNMARWQIVPALEAAAELAQPFLK